MSVQGAQNKHISTAKRQMISGNGKKALYWMVAPAESCVEATTEFDELAGKGGFEYPNTWHIIGLPWFNTKVSCANTMENEDGKPCSGAFTTPPTDVDCLALLHVASPDGVNAANLRPATRILLIPRSNAAAPAGPALKESDSDAAAPLALVDNEITA